MQETEPLDRRNEGDVETVIAEISPGVAVVFGPRPIELDLVDCGFVTSADLAQISSVLAAAGHAATVAGNVGQAMAGIQGLYRVNEATHALLASGAKLAVKDGANLGTVLTSEGLKQARFLPVTGLTAAQTAAAIGPAIATIALQLQLSEITSLVKTNVALTRQVYAAIERDQRADLAALVATIDKAVAWANELQCVPASVWDTVANSQAAVWKQQELHRDKVAHHIRQIGTGDTRSKSDYLRFNAQSIAEDATALLSSLHAWTGLQALHAGRARTAGRDDPDEQRLVEVIARDTREKVETSMSEIRTLTDALTRELRLLVELPGRRTIAHSLPGSRSGTKVLKESAASVLAAITPLADALHPPAPPLSPPAVLCIEDTLDTEPFLKILRWFLADDEPVQALGFAERESGSGVTATLGQVREKVNVARDKATTGTLIVVTDRRVFTADSEAFLTEGAIDRNVPLEDIRYVRHTPPDSEGGPSQVDVTTREADLHWRLPAAAAAQINGLVAVLAHAMNLPESERRDLMETPTLSRGSGTAIGRR